MATGYHTTTTHDVMIPESWRKELILELYSQMVMRKLITEIPIPEGVDKLHFPNIAKLTAEAITQGTELVGKVNAETQTDLTINQNYGVPFTIAKRLLIQAQKNVSLLDIYKTRAIEALAWQADQALLGLYSGLSQEVACSGDITKAKILEARRLLNKANAPKDNRHLVISPEQEEAILNIDNFVDASKYGSASGIQEGAIGKIFGFLVWVTDAVLLSTTRKNLAFHRDFAMVGFQQDIEVEVGPYMPLKQGFDVVASDLYGYTEIRDTFGVVITTTD